MLHTDICFVQLTDDLLDNYVDDGCAYAAKVCSTYPSLEESGAIEQILPKKEQALLAKL